MFLHNPFLTFLTKTLKVQNVKNGKKCRTFFSTRTPEKITAEECCKLEVLHNFYTKIIDQTKSDV